MSFTGTSYGMLLQAFATQYIIEKLGYQTEIIQYRPKSFIRPRIIDWGFFYFVILVLKARFCRSSSNKLPDEFHQNNHNLRVAAANAFRKQYLHNIREIVGNKALLKAASKYHAVVIGSDQCWIPGALFSNVLSLRFVPENVLKISYATSLGVSEYPRYCYHSAKVSWRRFDHLSVREEQGRNIVKTICGRDFPVEVVLDPTYLITKEEWERLIPVQEMEKERYVLSFILGANAEQQRCVRRYADFKGLKLLSILSNEGYSEIDTTYADRIIVGNGPEQFINLIRGAEYVFTDSFHGIAFSIINQKQFFVFQRYANKVIRGSRHSRISNILQLWKIEDRLLSDTNIDWENQPILRINYDNVNRILTSERKRSLSFLADALSDRKYD